MKDKVKIFVLYHDIKPIFKNEIITPLLTGACSKDFEFDGYKDNTGDNISSKNKIWAELTAHYWVCKNFIPQNPSLEYVGFCHYRRFFDILNKKKTKLYKKIYWKKYSKTFESRNNIEKIYDAIKDYDIVLPTLFTTKRKNLYEDYCSAHPKGALDKLIEIIKRDYPDYVDSMNEALFSKQGYFCLNFIMKKELFVEFFDWLYEILSKLENEDNLNAYYEKDPVYNNIKIPAYITERFINVWINYKIKTSSLKILEANTLLLTDFGLESRNPIFRYVKVRDQYKITLFNFINITCKKFY